MYFLMPLPYKMIIFLTELMTYFCLVKSKYFKGSVLCTEW